MEHYFPWHFNWDFIKSPFSCTWQWYFKLHYSATTARDTNDLKTCKTHMRTLPLLFPLLPSKSESAWKLRLQTPPYTCKKSKKVLRDMHLICMYKGSVLIFLLRVPLTQEGLLGARCKARVRPAVHPCLLNDTNHRIIE